jgi:iron complex outermembrane receptor protein
VARVEVLKGPQGTLFGASSMSGTIRVISNKPNLDDFDSRVSVRGDTLTNGDPGYGGDLMFNVPLIPGQLALRGVGWHETRGGFIDEFSGLNAATCISNANDRETNGARLMARYTPVDALTLDAFAMFQKATDAGPLGFSNHADGTLQPIDIISGPPFVLGSTVPPLAGVVGNDIVTSPATSESSSKVSLYSATAAYDLGIGSLLATGSMYRNDPYFLANDTSGIGARFGLIDVPGFFASGVPQIPAPFRVQQLQDRELSAGELRFSSKFGGPLQFVVGVFYERDVTDTELNIVLTDPLTGRSLCRSHASCVADPTSAAARSLVFSSQTVISRHSEAAFAHVAYTLSPSFTLDAGTRYYGSREHDRISTLQAFQGSEPSTLPPAFGGAVQAAPILGLDDSATASKVTWETSLSYRNTPERFFYVRAATGFRQGGINDTSDAKQIGQVLPATFAPDSVLNYEAGAKTTWLDRRLTANAALFTMRWNNMQVPQLDATGSANFIDNAARARIEGVEVEWQAQPTQRWLLGFASTWLHARLTKDQDMEAAWLQFPAGYRGDPIPKVPDLAMSGGAAYSFALPVFGGVEAVVQANVSYRQGAPRYFNSSFENDSNIGGYCLMNAGLNFARGPWQLRFFVDNLTDRRPVLDEYGHGADPQYQITAEPRSIGLQLMWNHHGAGL